MMYFICTTAIKLYTSLPQESDLMPVINLPISSGGKLYLIPSMMETILLSSNSFSLRYDIMHATEKGCWINRFLWISYRKSL